MHISALRISNFRNFQSLVVDPFPRNAVVVGENGVGKSNLLTALQLVLDPTLPRSARRLKETDVCAATLASTPLADVEVRVEVELQGFEDLTGALSQFDGWIISKSPLTARVTYVWRMEHAPDEAETDASDVAAHNFVWRIFGGSDESRDANRIVDELPLTVVPALRDAARDLANWRTSPLAAIVEMRPPSRTVIDTALAAIASATDKIAADTALLATGNRLRARLDNMSGQHLSVDPTMGVAASRGEQLVRSLRLFIDSSRSRDVSDTSTGGANVVYLALLLERLALRTEDDTQLDFVLGVEEPEAHLHPTLQRKLFGFLLQAYTKLVLTTHSPNIAAVADLASVILLRSDQSTGVTTARTVPTADLTPVELADLDRYLDTSRAELLFAKAVVLVEGIADVYVMRSLAERLGFDLDAWGVVVASVQGTDFGPYRKLLGPEGFDIPHLVVTDGDQDVNNVTLSGLVRAARLIGGAEGEEFETKIVAFREDDSTIDPEALYAQAAAAGIYVGQHTLEVDLCPLLGTELARAVSDLLSPDARTDPAQRVDDLLNNNTPDTRHSLLLAVDNVSKGRLGQRVANEILALPEEHPLVRLSDEELAGNPLRYMIDAINAAAVMVGAPVVVRTKAG
ncbi:ATP-dependent nuclease [Corynebacterium macginleyi]|uniref:ATP-dependent nuclease n=1 Tax=Corynebacterium macginleyi TaxID=38290 RepID=UPI00190A0AB8|nr:AAA family ATPase [Corynebacterium macginleyi]MBK4138935.1 AAA family ATPase [Corynebacterium macginleyi]MBK4148290.1 AAA family ATPase [Corynebacterium macginleyi]MBK4160098.1 AAA family ATPase [Corynebacterium macginleyi]